MNTEGVNEEIVKAFLAGKKKELDVRRIAERCKENRNEMGERYEGRQVEMQIRSQRVEA